MAKTSSGKFSVFLLLPLVAGICWGTTGSFVRILTAAGLDNATVLFSRTLPAAVILFFLLLVYDRKLLRVRPKDLWIFIVCGVVGMMGLNICYNVSIIRLSLSFAAVLLSMAPIFVLLLSALLFHERITKRKVLCMLLALAGCILVSGVIGSFSTTSLSAFGVLIGICSAIFYSFYSIFLKIALNRGYHSFTITFYSVVFLTIALLPIADLSAYGTFVSTAPAAHGLYTLLPALLNSVLPYILYNIGMAKTEAGIASIISSGGEPAAATVFGFLFFQEAPTVISLTGLVITILAIALLLRSPSKPGTDFHTDLS